MELKKYRIAKGITQQQLADILGVKQHAISNYELGEREPSLKILKQLAEALECTIDDLLADI